MNTTSSFQPSIEIKGRRIGPGQPPYVVAELSGNHKGDLDRALALIDAAAATGADAIKIQTYRPDTITLKHDGPEFRIEGGLWAGRTLYDLYEEAHTPWEWHEALFERARQNQITLFSSPFDATAIDLLESLNCPAYKIASFEITDLPLIERATATGKPIIISTGLATLEEIEEAVSTVSRVGGDQLILLHCISGYPTPIEDCNLATLQDLNQRFSFPIGLSDHTQDNTAAITAIAMGAHFIEKHFTLDRNDGSVDAEFSLEPESFTQLVHSCQNARKAIGKVNYDLKASEAGGREFRRSLYISKAVKKGDRFTPDNVQSVRPGLGLHPRHTKQVLNSLAAADLPAGTPLSWEHIHSLTS